jgi:hypothetical protein
VDGRGGVQDLSSGPPFITTVSLSVDGRYIGFTRPSPGGVYSDDFVYDRMTSATGKASVALGGNANGNSYDVAFSGDDSLVAFPSAATNLVVNARTAPSMCSRARCATSSRRRKSRRRTWGWPR